MKKISIMLTSYNLEGYIDTSISSVVNQIFPCDWELLIGDDGSTDKTVEKVNVWVNKYPQNIHLFQWSKEDTHSMNGFRAAANRAKLLERATGDYLIFLDGDDCWLGTEKLKQQFEYLESPEYANCSCCGHNIYRYNVETQKGFNMVNARYKKRVFSKKDYYRHGMYIHTNTLLFRSSCKELMLDSLYKSFLNDIFITFCMLQFGSMLYLPESYAQYNITGSGLWTGGNRVYGRFRNMHIYDLERNIDSNLEPLIFRGACTNMEVILNEYTKDDIPQIQPLVEGLDPQIFEYTLRMFNITKRSDENTILRKSLKRRILLAKINYKLFTIKRRLRLI